MQHRPNSYETSNSLWRLTQITKYWEYTCTFCFKSFPSAQALGGHQNAHRTERMEEKRLYVKDPMGYRKRSFIRSIKPHAAEPSVVGPIAVQYCRAMDYGNNLYQPYLRQVNWKPVSSLDLNLLLPRESRAVVGGGRGGCMNVCYDAAKARAFNDGKDDDDGINREMLDLTLKL